jgi:hypothetical protein
VGGGNATIAGTRWRRACLPAAKGTTLDAHAPCPVCVRRCAGKSLAQVRASAVSSLAALNQSLKLLDTVSGFMRIDIVAEYCRDAARPPVSRCRPLQVSTAVAAARSKSRGKAAEAEVRKAAAAVRHGAAPELPTCICASCL